MRSDPRSHANRVGRKKCPRPRRRLARPPSGGVRASGREHLYWITVLSGSEREAVGSCVRLSESVPALAIKSGRGSGEARVLKCSLWRVGFCLPRAVSERLLAVVSAASAVPGVSWCVALLACARVARNLVMSVSAR